ncbi:hypothetical protein [Sulfurimonas paralvinellae]|uniref:Uncharacterized protein n=1 Tax=Sulfurimonas paralvinellae TaxID=317658 RepID=A0A7M1BCR5_9BACT|nr:hypothetical protein [Sulfurimonas paralvinellae]QOP46582.1 hypothetical protein FM071_09880 [Sulfurimonas paralvinellae]
MCIPHGATRSKDNGFVKEKKSPKHVKKVSQREFEKGDPDFVDERTSSYTPKKKGSFFDELFS